jgi:heme o synthase
MVKTYYLLTKPGIIYGNAIIAAGGFALASRGALNGWLFLALLAGLSLVIASACVFNNFMDRDIDAQMKRTKNRPSVTGAISEAQGLFFAVLLMLVGSYLLWHFTTPVAVAVAVTGWLVYVVPYDILKRRSAHVGTLIGSVSGAIPPVVGYAAVTGRIDIGAVIFFMMIFLWQMPHFFAIAVYRLNDYKTAAIPVLPITSGMRNTKISITLYTAAFVVACTLLTVFGYTSLLYLGIALALGLWWLWTVLQGFHTTNDIAWGRKVFTQSLILITALCGIIAIDVALFP